MSFTKRNKKVRRKKKFLMGVKEYWLIEDALMPTYAHHVDFYSHKLHKEWSVKVGDFEGTSEVKEECEDGSIVSQPDDESISRKRQQVMLMSFILASCLLDHTFQRDFSFQ